VRRNERNREKVRQGESGYDGDGTTEKDRVAMSAITCTSHTMYRHFLLYMNCIVDGSYRSTLK
jgi:hypothetical protein